MLAFFRKNKRFCVVLLLIVIPVYTVMTLRLREKNIYLMDRLILAISNPLQELAGNVAQGVKQVWNHYFFLVAVQKENESLSLRNRGLVGLINRYKEMEVENQRLRNLLTFREHTETSMLPAEIIAEDFSREYQMLKINKGADHGIRKGMAVVAPDGVVGKIFAVTGGYAEVLTVFDPHSDIDALIQRTRARGIVEGKNKALFCHLKYVERMDDVIVGDMVVTSGLGGLFPKGIPLGTVVDVRKRNYGVTQDIELLPAVDFSKLEEVLVVLEVEALTVVQPVTKKKDTALAPGNAAPVKIKP